MRLLPGTGTYEGKLQLRITARSTPAPPTSGSAGEWTVAQMESSMEETIHVRRDATGHVAGRRDLTPDEGFHFVLVDRQICLGFRYEPPVCRTPDENEGEQRIAELLGAWEDIHFFLEEQAKWHPENDNGAIKKYKLSRAESPKKPGGKLRELTGSFSFNPTNGIIEASVRYKLDAERKDGLLYTLEVAYEHRILREAEPVTLPENAVKQADRLRPLMDRRVLLGDFTPHSLRDLYRAPSAE